MKTTTVIPTLSTLAIALASAALLITAAPAAACGPPRPQQQRLPEWAAERVLNTTSFGDLHGPLPKVRP